MVGFFEHQLFLKHLEGYGHVEQPERVKIITERVRLSSLVDQLAFYEAEPAELEWLEAVHEPAYVEGILELDANDAVILDWGDTVATPATPQAALHAAGCGVQAAKLVLDKKISSAFCAVRPPGHHAETNRAMGFCIFNNIAVAAAYLTRTAKLSRVAVIDWDVHHGNGTENIFSGDERVFYISLHQYPHYPGTGPAEMRGTGRGEGFTLNLPMGPRAGDREYLRAFDDKIIPALDDYKPEFILISAGFDAHAEDPLSDTALTTEAYHRMTVKLADSAARHCQGRIVSMLEGGYNPGALADSVEAHIGALVDADTKGV